MRTSTASENLPTNTNIHTHTNTRSSWKILTLLVRTAAASNGIQQNSPAGLKSQTSKAPNTAEIRKANNMSKNKRQHGRLTRAGYPGKVRACVCVWRRGEKKKGGGGSHRVEPDNTSLLIILFYSFFFFFCMFVFASDKTREEGHRGQNIEKPVRVLPSLVTSATSAARKPGRPTMLRATPEVQVL